MSSWLTRRNKRDAKIALAGALAGMVLGAWIAHPSQPSPGERMRAEVERTNADTDAWLAEMERDLAEQEDG